MLYFYVFAPSYIGMPYKVSKKRFVLLTLEINRIHNMKKFILCVLITLAFMPLSAQNLLNTAFDTNGPVGELLFNQNDSGDIVYSGVVEAPFSADTLLGLAREFFYRMANDGSGIKISERFDGITMVGSQVEIPVGVKLVAAPFAGAWVKAASTVKFNLIIDLRPGKFRYTLSGFQTDRWRIPGEGKDKGQSNLLHWQRINSLNKEMAKTKGKEKEEIEAMIEKERESYKMEYAAVMNFIERVKGFAVIEDF